MERISAAGHALPRSSSVRTSAAAAAAASIARFERRHHALARRLAERHEPHAGGDEVREEGVEVERERAAAREAVHAARGARPPPEGSARAPPPRASAAIASSARVGPGVRHGRRGRRCALALGFERELRARPERLRELRHLEEAARDPSPRRSRTRRAPPRRARCRSASSSPSQRASERLVAHVAGLDRALEPVRVGERADRERRREPRREARRLAPSSVSMACSAWHGCPPRARRARRTRPPPAGRAPRSRARARRGRAPCRRSRGRAGCGSPSARSSAGTWRFPMCQPSRSRPVRVVARHLEQRLGRGAHRDPGARLGAEPVALRERGGLRQVEQQLRARVGGEAQAAAVPVVVVERDAVAGLVGRPVTGVGEGDDALQCSKQEVPLRHRRARGRARRSGARRRRAPRRSRGPPRSAACTRCGSSRPCRSRRACCGRRRAASPPRARRRGRPRRRR